MQTALGIFGFFAFLFGSLALAALTGAAVARITKSAAAWLVLSLASNLAVQTVYVSALNLVRCIWMVQDGDGTFGERYRQVVAAEWLEGVKYGLLFGAVAWVWSLKRAGEFMK